MQSSFPSFALKWGYSTGLGLVARTYLSESASREFSFLRNTYNHNKDESLLRWGYQVKPPTGNGFNPIGDAICIDR